MTDTYELTEHELNCIRELAYEKFIGRGCENGHDLEDWLAAEQEVRANHGEAEDTNGKSSVREQHTKKGRRSSSTTAEAATAQ